MLNLSEKGNYNSDRGGCLGLSLTRTGPSSLRKYNVICYIIIFSDRTQVQLNNARQVTSSDYFQAKQENHSKLRAFKYQMGDGGIDLMMMIFAHNSLIR